ncbi:hypothetical protein FACS1894120_6340 [Clostridia bacterium]|nr:hypothetical protein FACS1894120_6340 [Clostridia bacterium]
MKKIILTLLTALTALVLLSACGENKQDKQTTNTDTPNTSVETLTSNSEVLNTDTNTEITTVETTAPVEIDITDKFTDKNFLKYVRSLVNKTNDEPVYLSDVSEIKEVKPDYNANKEITSFDGIEYFAELTELITDPAPITAIDLSKNTKLEVFTCNKGNLTTLDLSNNPELTRLQCSENQLTELDLSNNPKLTSLHCRFNEIKELDLSNNPKLYEDAVVYDRDKVTVKYYNENDSLTTS